MLSHSHLSDRMWLNVIFLVLCLYNPSVLCENDAAPEAALTLVQSSNLYCSSNYQKHIYCNFNHTDAILGNLSSIFTPGSRTPTKTLRIEIVNCSSLMITSQFQTGWRSAFESLDLSVTHVDDVIQEEAAAVPSLQLISNQINFSLRYSKMGSIFPFLVSDTAGLMIDVLECKIGVLSEGALRNVGQVWQLRVFRTNISQIEGRATPQPLPLAPAPSSIHLEWTPAFILNETGIGLINEDAIKFRITEKDEFLNIVNSQILAVSRGGFRVEGAGHFLVADTVLGQLEHDAIIVDLSAKELSNVHQSLSHPTITLMGVEISDVNVTNFLNNLQAHQGKLYLLRMKFHFPGALSSILKYGDRWDSPREAVFVEGWSVLCTCNELAEMREASNNVTTTTESSGSGSQLDFDYEDIGQTPPKEPQSPPPSVGWHIRSEITCRDESRKPLNLTEYEASECSPATTPIDSSDAITEKSQEEAVVEDKQEEDPGYLFYSSIVGGILLTFFAIAGVLYAMRHQRKSFTLTSRAKQQPHKFVNNKKQVGVISEVPICDGNEGEEDCEL